MRSIGACGPHVGQISVVQGTSSSWDLLIGHDPLLKFMSLVGDFKSALSIQRVDFRIFAAEEGHLVSSSSVDVEPRAPACEGGRDTEADCP
jgi:hypothetical protein|eukprot:7383637-Prymnesium_polylepis.1